MAMTLQEPVSVVVLNEPCNSNPSFVDRFEAVNVEDLLLQGSVEAFDDSIALWTSHKGRRESQAEIVHLPSEIP